MSSHFKSVAIEIEQVTDTSKWETDHELLAGDDGREGEVCNQAQADEGGEGAEGDGVDEEENYLTLTSFPSSLKQPSLTQLSWTNFFV